MTSDVSRVKVFMADDAFFDELDCCKQFNRTLGKQTETCDSLLEIRLVTGSQVNNWEII